jgi:hypothetical protein
MCLLIGLSIGLSAFPTVYPRQGNTDTASCQWAWAGSGNNGAAHEKITYFACKQHEENPMDTEQINQIGAQIEDLRAREAALRGYL